ncbi:MAG TPA: class F sortase [Pedococcus sp.]|jgi:hypothetical protein|nr:class F sortase [Pedococcus sp.]
MRGRSPWATQQAVVGFVLIATALVLLLLSLEGDWTSAAIASAASLPTATEGAVGGVVGDNAQGPARAENVAAASARLTGTTAPAPASTRGASATHLTAPAPARDSSPLVLQIPAIALSAAITPYTPAQVAASGGAVKPPTLFSVSWWTGGGNPGTTARNTVYLYGHTWKEPAVFNRIKELRTGARVDVTTTAGRLVYVVDGSFTVSKPDLVTNPLVTEAVPGRLLLIGCYRATGHEAHTTANIVVSAHLAS